MPAPDLRPHRPDRRPADSSALVAAARAGDRNAVDELLTRYLPRLRHWAHGRVPGWARTIADTSDFVQDVALNALQRIGSFEPRTPGALSAYLRQAVRNRLCDEHRRVARRGTRIDVPDGLVDRRPSPVQEAMATEIDARYRAALLRLAPRDRELIVAHVELGYSHEQLGCMIGRSRNAARMALRRAIERLSEELRT